MLDSPTAAYAVGVPAIMVGSILLIAAIIALLEPRHDRDDQAHGH
jgi:hypothetical protein